MPSPVTPGDFEGAVSSPTSTICGNFVNTLLRLPTMIFQLVSWMFTSSGNVSNAFKQEIIPPGFVMAGARAAVPDGWLLCNGQEVLRADYPELFLAIGILYGDGDGSTTFEVPDFRARFLVGVGSFANQPAAVLGTPAGEDEVSLDAGEAGLSHTHPVGRFEADGSGISADNAQFLFSDVDLGLDAEAARKINGAGSGNLGTLADGTGKYIVTGPPINPSDGEAVETDAHNNLPPYHPVNWFIKT